MKKRLNASNETKRLLGVAAENREKMRAASADLVGYILKANQPEKFMADMLSAARLQYGSLKGNTDAQKAVASDWRDVTNGMRYHFTKADMRAEWPSIRGNDGQPTLKSATDARADKRAETAANKERERAALASATAEREAAEIQALRELGPEELASELADTIRSWSNRKANQTAVLTALATAFKGTYQPPKVAKRTSRKTANQPPKVATA